MRAPKAALCLFTTLVPLVATGCRMDQQGGASLKFESDNLNKVTTEAFHLRTVLTATSEASRSLEAVGRGDKLIMLIYKSGEIGENTPERDLADPYIAAVDQDEVASGKLRILPTEIKEDGHYLGLLCAQSDLYNCYAPKLAALQEYAAKIKSGACGAAGDSDAFLDASCTAALLAGDTHALGVFYPVTVKQGAFTSGNYNFTVLSTCGGGMADANGLCRSSYSAPYRNAEFYTASASLQGGDWFSSLLGGFGQMMSFDDAQAAQGAAVQSRDALATEQSNFSYLQRVTQPGNPNTNGPATTASTGCTNLPRYQNYATITGACQPGGTTPTNPPAQPPPTTQPPPQPQQPENPFISMGGRPFTRPPQQEPPQFGGFPLFLAGLGQRLRDRVGRNGDDCFFPGTLVLTREGAVNVEDLREGDEILNPIKSAIAGQPTFVRIASTQSTGTAGVTAFELMAGGQTIRVTHKHPVVIREDGASKVVTVLDLRQGMEILLGSGYVTLDGKRQIATPEIVYNFTVGAAEGDDTAHYALADGFVSGDLQIQLGLEDQRQIGIVNLVKTEAIAIGQ